MTAYNRLIGFFHDTDEYQDVLDTTLCPVDKYAYISIQWYAAGVERSAGVTWLEAIQAQHPNAKILAYMNFGAMIGGTHEVGVDAITRPTSLVTQQEAVSHGIGADSWFLHPTGATAKTITTSSTATPPLITTSTAHGLAVNDYVVIVGHSISARNGVWKVASVPLTTTFTVTGMTGGSSGTGGQVQKIGTYCDYEFLAWADISRSSWRTQATSRLAQIAADGFDGVFLDDVNTQSDQHCWTDGMFQSITTAAGYRTAMLGGMAVVTPACRTQGLLSLPNIGVNPWDSASNTAYRDLLTANNVDGVIREFWTNWGGILNDPPFTGATWSAMMGMMLDAEGTTYGNSVPFLANNYPLNPLDHFRALDYGLASYYLHWNGSAASAYGYNDGEPVSIYNRYAQLLGTPLESRQVYAGAGDWSDTIGIRHFTGGVVAANARTSGGAVSVALGRTYYDPDGNAVTSVALDPGRGAVFVVTAVAGGGAAGAVKGYFNGVARPRIQVLAGFGGTLDPGTTYLHLGVGPGLGTGLLGGAGVGVNEVDITADVRSISLDLLGPPTDIDAADPVTATIVLSNRHGNYDPSNPNSPYVVATPFQATATDTTPTINSLQYGGPSSSGCTNSVVTASAGGYLHDMGGASAATPNGTNPAVAAGTYSFWNDTPSGAGVYNWQSVRWRCRPDLDTQSTAGYFWAHQGALTSTVNTFGNVWYAGLQSRSSLSGNPKALNFAIWGGVGGISGGIAGTVSQAFTGEGDGWQIMAPYTWVAGRTYSLQMSADPARGDRWFSLHIKDETTGTVTWHGSIQAGPTDSSYVRGISYNFSELFSQVTPATTCPLLPRATTWFSAPTFSQSAVGATGLEDGTPIRVRYTWQGVAYNRFYGELAGVDLNLDYTPDATATLTCRDGLEKLGRAYLPTLGLPDRDGDRTGARINYLADQAGYPSVLRSIDTGYTTLASTVLGEYAAELMHQVENTEFGTLFVDGGGVLTFYDRHQGALSSRSTTVQATFTDSGAAGTVKIPALVLSRNRERSFNRVAITRDPIPSAPVIIGDGDLEESPDEPVEQIADDITAQIKGVLAFPAEVGQLHRNDHEALAMAQYLVARFKTTQNRISEIQVNMLRGGWDQLLPLGPLDRVAVSRNYGPNTISTELLIQGVGPEEVTVEPPSWSLTFTTSNPPPTPTLWTLGTSALGSGHLGW